MNDKEVVLSGIRPTGELHLGNKKGVIDNFIYLQNFDKYKCIYFIADLHAATTENDVKKIQADSLSVLADMLACGVDYKKNIIFKQSDVPLVMELGHYFSYLINVSELQRNPVYRDQLKELNLRGGGTCALLNYPILQAADICLYKSLRVPVGRDQLPHVELAREIVRRFNRWVKKDIFPIPESLLTNTPNVPGIDGRKMSKSYNNEISFAHSKEEVENRISRMITDIKRPRRNEPGHPEECIAFQLHKCVSTQDEQQEIMESCKNASLGCVECKRKLAKTVNNYLDPIRDARTYWLSHIDQLKDILSDGAARAYKIAEKTIEEVRAHLFNITYIPERIL